MQREKEEKKGSSTLVCKETWMYKMCVNHHNLLTMVFLFWDFFSQKNTKCKRRKRWCNPTKTQTTLFHSDATHDDCDDDDGDDGDDDDNPFTQMDSFLCL
jgi:hypothetical protein